MLGHIDVEIRPITAEEIPPFRAVLGYAFGGPDILPTADDDDLPILPDWTTCAFVDGRLATTFGAFPFRVRLNGRSVAMAGVTMVATLPEFRRRGILRKVMTQALGEQRDRGQSIAILWASMGAIYQRYGYGLATVGVNYSIDPRRIAFNSGAPASGSVRLMPREEARPIFEQIYKEFNRPRNLLIQRAARMWDVRYRGGLTHFGVYYNGAGEATGFVAVQIGHDETLRPDQVLNVVDHAALDADAYRGIWEYLASHDLVGQVRWIRVPEDDPAPLLMLEPRELQKRTGDAIWMRVTDVAAALPQRPYGDADALTLSIRDELCPWNHKTFVMETTGDTTEVREATGSADLTMPVASLAVLLSGHRSATTLSRAGLIEVASEKILTRADRLFATAYAPWCNDNF